MMFKDLFINEESYKKMKYKRADGKNIPIKYRVVNDRAYFKVPAIIAPAEPVNFIDKEEAHTYHKTRMSDEFMVSKYKGIGDFESLITQFLDDINY